jgi:hypothetical protein
LRKLNIGNVFIWRYIHSLKVMNEIILNSDALQHTKHCAKQMGSSQTLHTESAQLGQVARRQWQLGSLKRRDSVKVYFVCLCTLSDVYNAGMFIAIFT